METYKITFKGRLNSAIGSTYKIKEVISAETEAAAELKLYDKYEHITNLKITTQLWKCIKICRISRRRQVLERRLTKTEAQRVCARYPDSSRSMVVMYYM